MNLVSKVENTIRKQEPAAKEGEAYSYTSMMTRIFYQLLFGLVYYFLIVQNYPELPLKTPSEEVMKFQELDEVRATFQSSWKNVVLSWCCTGPRAAHTFATVGVFNYWLGIVLMSIFPCCTLFAMNSFSELNEKLGGKQRGILMSALCSFCCLCCVVTQDAESLDMICNVKTEFCGVTQV